MQGFSAPTDSLYKFSAIAGLLLIVASGIGIYDMSRSELLARRERGACYAQTLVALKQDRNKVAEETFLKLAQEAISQQKPGLTAYSLRKIDANPDAIAAASRFDVATIVVAQEYSVLSLFGGILIVIFLAGIFFAGFGIHRWYFLEQKLKDMEVRQKIAELSRANRV